MTLRKAMILTFFLNVLSISAFTQNKDSLNVKPPKSSEKKFYYQMGLGYNFFAGIGSRANNVTDRDLNYSQENFNSSYGKGVDISFGFGLKVAKNLALELDLGYLIGGKSKEEDQFYDTISVYWNITKESVSSKANTFRINPKLVFEVPIKEKNAIYSKMGYMVGFGNAKSEIASRWEFDNGWYGEGSSTRVYSGGFVSGSTMALGMRFATKEEDTYFFMEVTGSNLHRKFKKGTLTEAAANGGNQIDNQPPYYKEFIYVDKAEYQIGAPDLDKPRQIPAYRSNYSSVGFRLGFIKYF